VINPHALVFRPILMEKVWGGRRLAALGKQLPEHAAIGESWELADLASTSPSGGGGAAARSVIASGPLAGKTLADAIALWRQDLLGGASLTSAGGFPLLVKFLDARENLSVQVHPSPAYAAAHTDSHLKTECWYVLAAEPVNGRPPVIYKGIKPGVAPEAFARHIADGSVVNDLIAVPAIPGECHNLPSGTCHALGAGVLVAEVQTPSDTTFRVYDWGRQGRELHLAQALECIEFGPAPAATRLAKGRLSGRLVHTEFFTVTEASLPAGGVLPLGQRAGPRVLMVLAGSLSIRTPQDEPVTVPAGSTALVPASIVQTAPVYAKPGARALIVEIS
jgi:mannose-6-phosphate isomerase